MKKILLALALFLGLGSIMYAAGSSSPIVGGPSWDNVRKVIRFMTSDEQEIQVAEAPKSYFATASSTLSNCETTDTDLVICSANMASIQRGELMPYRTVNGEWHVRFSIAVTLGTNQTSQNFFISGIALSPAYTQAVYVRAYTSGYSNGVAGSTNVIDARTSTGETVWTLAGDLVVLAKPLWMN